METQHRIPFPSATHEPAPVTDGSGPAPPASRHAGRWWVLAAGPAVGLVVGMVARGWMRLLSTDPEFSWSGSIFIAMAFTSVGLGHAVAALARRGRRRWSTVGRIVGAILVVPLFAGAGALMLPTVVAGSLSLWHPTWPRPVRLLIGALAVPAPAFVAVDTVAGGLTPGPTLGLLLMTATYAVVIWATGPITAPVEDGWRLNRRLRGLLIGATIVGGLALLAGITGIGG